MLFLSSSAAFLEQHQQVVLLDFSACAAVDACSTAAMAPNPVSDADYLRDKARRDLLALLEGVSKDHIVCTFALWKVIQVLNCLAAAGPREEEPGYRARSGWSGRALCQVLPASGVWCRSSLPAGECQCGLYATQCCVPSSWGEHAPRADGGRYVLCLCFFSSCSFCS